ncbi:SLC41A family transporter [Wolbachia endosymbiont of Nilaparvata lugens]|uniref:SLC41A family transporter n=1 Tax=Wolbachia endosymbiont of Nilaparvata lugens TaxID=357143 RepID=UPI00117F7709|nr:magnesium transporter [Wolbachia endosymbiont of Nilaparvata lugens]
MSRYEDLTEKQKELYNKLEDAIKDKNDITPILKEIKKEGALKEVLTTANITKKLDGTEYNLTPLGYAMNFNNFEEEIKVILDVAQKNSVLEELLNSMQESDRANLKKILESLKSKEQDEGQETKIDNWLAIVADSISSCESNEKPLVPESSVPRTEENIVKTTNKSIMIGSVCGVVAALAVGGGCFAAGVALPILALIGIAVAAFVLTGLVTGGITYEVCKPCNELNEVGSQLEVSSKLGATV